MFALTLWSGFGRALYMKKRWNGLRTRRQKTRPKNSSRLFKRLISICLTSDYRSRFLSSFTRKIDILDQIRSFFILSNLIIFCSPSLFSLYFVCSLEFLSTSAPLWLPLPHPFQGISQSFCPVTALPSPSPRSLAANLTNFVQKVEFKSQFAADFQTKSDKKSIAPSWVEHHKSQILV